MLTIVSTLYQSGPYIADFHRRITATAKQLVGDDYELILVNDGGPDNSLELALELIKTDPHVTVIELSRNFGHHKAMMTGLACARGNRVFLIDSDLEEEPEWLTSFSHQMDNENADVVFGVQERRRGGRLTRLTGIIFYRTFRILTGINQPDNIVTARLMTIDFVRALLAHPERELNIGGLWVLTGFRQHQHLVNKLDSSPTSYSHSHKISHFVNAVTSFSSAPLVFTFYAGLFISLSASTYIGYLLFRYLFISPPPDGYTSIIASIWFFSGLIVFFMGIQGIYIAKVFSEVKRRPNSIIRKIYRHKSREVKLHESGNQRSDNELWNTTAGANWFSH